ncbi:MAG TPA: hypothetical protein VEO01_19215 [Pseudonocardiaceae bacterium]|nr:hypothetical protein [Pseudonocardiaceae bacterium]
MIAVSRRADGWQAEVPMHGVVNARSLQALDGRVRVLLAGERPAYRFRTDNSELDRLVRHVQSARAAVRRYEEKTRRFTDHVLLLPSGLSQRDLGVLLGLSHQRVYQLVARQRVLTRSTQAG